MKFRFRLLVSTLTALSAAFVVAACGGGSGPSNQPDEPGPGTMPTGATAIGEPIGPVASARIGRDGGTLRSADGRIVVEVPSGAFANDEIVTVQEIGTTAHGAPGRAWRVGPASLAPALPVTLRFAFDESDLQGSAAAEQRVAYQDAQRRWVVPAAPEIDTSARTVTVRTTRFRDWLRFAQTSLTPSAATLKVGQQLALKVTRCEIVGFEAGDGDADAQLVRTCGPAPEVKTMAPQVNGQVGGSAGTGSVVRPDAERAEYLYTAPAQAPNPRTVAISVETLLAGAPGTSARSLLVSNVTIEDEQDSVCAWVRTADAFSFDVLVGSFSVRAAQEDASYSGTGKMSVQVRLKRITPDDPSVPVMVFSSVGEPATGLVSVHGTLQVTDPAAPYTQDYAAASAPTADFAPISPSYFVLSVDTRDCRYALAGGAVGRGSIEGGPGATSSAAMTPGALHFRNLPVAAGTAANRTILVEGMEAPYALDTDAQDGFMPWTSLLSLPHEPGSALISWTLTAVPK